MVFPKKRVFERPLLSKNGISKGALKLLSLIGHKRMSESGANIDEGVDFRENNLYVLYFKKLFCPFLMTGMLRNF